MSEQLCWICGAIADSAEHIVKASDLRSVFGPVTQRTPVFRQSQAERNVAIRGVDTHTVKFRPSICQQCNNATTQPYDLAWQALSAAAASSVPPLRKGAPVPVREAFEQRVEQSMLRVQLFFIKLLGCHAVEQKIPLPLNAFAVCLLGGYAHPHVYLSFVHESSSEGKAQIHVGNIKTANVNGVTVGATWYYVVGTFGVLLSYSEHGRPSNKGGQPVWHPDDDPSRLLML